MLRQCYCPLRIHTPYINPHIETRGACARARARRALAGAFRMVWASAAWMAVRVVISPHPNVICVHGSRYTVLGTVLSVQPKDKEV